MRVLSLFSGIGGMDLGLERAGMTIVGQCEIDPVCRRVLRHHWPDIPLWDDVRTLARRCGDCDPEDECGEVRCPLHDMDFGDCPCVGTDQLIDEIGPIDAVCGGFPCQDVSNAGLREGIDGEQSGLWAEFFRVVCEVGPRLVIVENTSGLLDRGHGRVLGDLAGIGYDAEWFSLPASACGAPHRRARVFILAYPAGERREAYIAGRGINDEPRPCVRVIAGVSCKVGGAWSSEPPLCSVDDGIPARVGAMRGAGNAVVPQVAEVVGRAVMEAAKDPA